MRVLDLFSGIGGFSLGLERAGMRTVAFCEIDPYCRAVLREHWPDIPCDEDITKREFTEGEADVVCGGFPCQDISAAGLGAGLAGDRSGLWRELLRAIRLVRPRYAIVENVAALLGRGMGDVLGDLASIRYDAEWNCIPASAVGAPHRRDRVWIVAYPARLFERRQEQRTIGERVRPSSKPIVVADTSINGRFAWRSRDAAQEPQWRQSDRSGKRADMAHTDEPRLQRWISRFLRERPSQWTARTSSPSISDADSEQARRIAEPRQECGQWEFEPDVGRVAHGISSRVDRLKGLGNAVVPQIPEIIGRAIMQAEVKD